MQVSTVHGLPSLQATGVPAVHTPARHESPAVHALPVVHAVPSGAAGLLHVPDVGSQVPAAWHASDAAHTTPTHALPAPEPLPDPLLPVPPLDPLEPVVPPEEPELLEVLDPPELPELPVAIPLSVPDDGDVTVTLNVVCDTLL
jgi:hypothetical protein